MAAGRLESEIGFFSAIASVVANTVGMEVLTTYGFDLQEVDTTAAQLSDRLVGEILSD